MSSFLLLTRNLAFNVCFLQFHKAYLLFNHITLATYSASHKKDGFLLLLLALCLAAVFCPLAINIVKHIRVGHVCGSITLTSTLILFD